MTSLSALEKEIIMQVYYDKANSNTCHVIRALPIWCLCLVYFWIWLVSILSVVEIACFLKTKNLLKSSRNKATELTPYAIKYTVLYFEAIRDHFLKMYRYIQRTVVQALELYKIQEEEPEIYYDCEDKIYIAPIKPPLHQDSAIFIKKESNWSPFCGLKIELPVFDQNFEL